MSEKHAAPAAATTSESKPAKGGGWFVKLAVLLFMVALIVGECIGAYVYLSGGSTTASAATAEEHKAPPDESAGHETEPAHEPSGHAEHSEPAEKKAAGDHGHSESSLEGDEYTEMDLGQFTATVFLAASNTTLRIDFHLFGTIRTEDEHEFTERKAKAEHRFRDQVLVTVRSSEMSDFADPGLGLIKRKILTKSNETLGRPLLKAIVFSEFSLLEQ